MRERFVRFAVPLILLVMVAAACGNDEEDPAASGATGDTGTTGVPGDGLNPEGFRVGLALDVGGLGDKSFNDAAKRRSAAGDRRWSGLRGQCQRGELHGLEPRRERAGTRRRRIQHRDRERIPVLHGGPGGRADFPDTGFAVTDGFASVLFDDADDGGVEPMPKDSERRGPHLQGARGLVPRGGGGRARV